MEGETKTQSEQLNSFDYSLVICKSTHSASVPKHLVLECVLTDLVGISFLQSLFLKVSLGKSSKEKKGNIFVFNPANSALFAGLIRQIVSYLPDYENLRSGKGTYGPVRY